MKYKRLWGFDLSKERERKRDKYLDNLYMEIINQRKGKELMNNFIKGIQAFYDDSQREAVLYLTPLEIITLYAGMYESLEDPQIIEKLVEETPYQNRISRVIGEMHKKYLLGKVKNKEGVKEETYSTSKGELIKRLKRLDESVLENIVDRYIEVITYYYIPLIKDKNKKEEISKKRLKRIFKDIINYKLQKNIENKKERIAVYYN